MYVAVGQFAVTPDWQVNALQCVNLMTQARQKGASLLVLPEALLARDDNDPDLSVKSAQPLDGDFLQPLLTESVGNAMTSIFTVHVPSAPGRAVNTLVAIRDGVIIARYAKLHLYDAFSIQESRRVDPGDRVAPLIDIDGFKVGLMTCYDLRFPELALHLALQGADVLVLPAAWVKGPLKEQHWATLLAARALDTTCYVVASGECGNKNIGQSRVVDPLGATVAAAAEAPVLLMTEIFLERIALARQQLPVLRNRRFAPPQLM